MKDVMDQECNIGELCKHSKTKRVMIYIKKFSFSSQGNENPLNYIKGLRGKDSDNVT